MSVGDIYRVAVANFAGNQLGMCILHYRVQAQVGANQLYADIAAEFESVLGTVFRGAMSQNAGHLGVAVNKIYPGFPSVQTVNTDDQGVGATAGDMMSTQTSGIITWKTALAGRAFRGRSYIPFPGEGDNNADGHPTAGYVTKLDAIATAVLLLPTVTTGADSMVFEAIVYRKGAAALSERIIDSRSNAKWATQRRRGDYGRANQAPF